MFDKYHFIVCQKKNWSGKKTDVELNLYTSRFPYADCGIRLRKEQEYLLKLPYADDLWDSDLTDKLIRLHFWRECIINQSVKEKKEGARIKKTYICYKSKYTSFLSWRMGVYSSPWIMKRLLPAMEEYSEVMIEKYEARKTSTG
jgi:hypothetical protein